VGVKQRRVTFGDKEQVGAVESEILDAFRVVKVVVNLVPRLKPVRHGYRLTGLHERTLYVGWQITHHIRREFMWSEGRRNGAVVAAFDLTSRLVNAPRDRT
jgi:hypothetical protein